MATKSKSIHDELFYQILKINDKITTVNLELTQAIRLRERNNRMNGNNSARVVPVQIPQPTLPTNGMGIFM